jgi:hypothetical protein
MTRTSPRRCLAVTAAAACLLLVVGCGSTVQNRGTLTASQGGGGLTAPDGLTTTGSGAGEIGGSDSLGSTTGVTGPAATGGDSSGPAKAGAAAAGSAPQAGSGATTPAVTGSATGRGFTQTTVAIGVGTADDYNGVANSFDIKGVGYEGDPKLWMQAVADDLNRHGGLQGRKIVIVKHDYDTVQLLNDPASAHQAACATWTEDHPVFAVLLAGLLVDDTLLGCLAKANTPLIQVGAGLDYPLHYAKTYVQFPLYFNLAQMVGERYDRVAIGRLVARKFFAPWDTRTGRPGAAATPTKVGLIGFDDRDGAIQLANWKKELASHGLRDPSTIQCPRPLTNKISCEQSAVLRFATDGVTHVFGADTVFMNNAESQNYHPRYFIAVSARAFAANVSSSQLNGAMGEGYIPSNDVDTSEYPGDPTPATAYCKKVMKAAGQASADPSTLLLQLSVCDEFYFTKAAIDRAGVLGVSALRAGLEGLGSGEQSALTWTSFLGPREHASAAALRDLVYRSDLSRFTYVSRANYGDS